MTTRFQVWGSKRSLEIGGAARAPKETESSVARAMVSIVDIFYVGQTSETSIVAV